MLSKGKIMATASVSSPETEDRLYARAWNIWEKEDIRSGDNGFFSVYS